MPGCCDDIDTRQFDFVINFGANRWEVLSPSGEVLATRVLAHPHDNEQPFTRSLTNVSIPRDLAEVIVRAHDLEHGYGGKELAVQLPR